MKFVIELKDSHFTTAGYEHLDDPAGAVTHANRQTIEALMYEEYGESSVSVTIEEFMKHMKPRSQKK